MKNSSKIIKIFWDQKKVPIPAMSYLDENNETITEYLYFCVLLSEEHSLLMPTYMVIFYILPFCLLLSVSLTLKVQLKVILKNTTYAPNWFLGKKQPRYFSAGYDRTDGYSKNGFHVHRYRQIWHKRRQWVKKLVPWRFWKAWRGVLWWRTRATCHNWVTVAKKEHFLKSSRFSRS